MCQFDDRYSVEVYFMEGVGYRGVVHVPLAQRFAPSAVFVLVAQMQKNNLSAVLSNEPYGIDAPAYEPVEVRAKFCIGNACKRSFLIMEIVHNFIGLIVQIGLTPVSFCK